LGGDQGIFARNSSPLLSQKCGDTFPLDETLQVDVFDGFGKLAFGFRQPRRQDFPVTGRGDFHTVPHLGSFCMAK
jgi:hypothetical protein